MRTRLAMFVAFLVAGCLGNPLSEPAPTDDGERRVSPLQAQGATITDDGQNRTFAWKGTLGRGIAPPLVGSVGQASESVSYQVPVDDSVGTITIGLTGTDAAAARLRTDQGRSACVARTGRVCTVEVTNDAAATWDLTVVSLAPNGVAFEVKATLDPRPPVFGVDPTPGGTYEVFDAGARGGEPTLYPLKDGRVLVVAGGRTLRMSADGKFTDATPPIDQRVSATLDPFLVGDPATDRVYVSQLASCMKLSWTDNGGDSWTSNVACGGPELHHQKLSIGPGPAGRMVHLSMMNLASWLTTDEVVVTHARSADGGVLWTQNPALVRQVHGMEARAVGNVAASEDGTVHIIAYLCDRFVDASYNGVGVGRSRDYGATWTWQKIGVGGGRCEGIDPGISAVGGNVYAAWWDFTSGTPAVWWAKSSDSGATWTTQAKVPTPGLESFVFVDAAASKERLVAHFLATPDTDRGPTQAHGWARWYPYVASLDLRDASANWSLVRLQDDPVQVGYICMDGPMCMDGARNLLDFNDVQIGRDGRAYVAYSDGCDANCTQPWQSRGAALRVVRSAACEPPATRCS